MQTSKNFTYTFLIILITVSGIVLPQTKTIKPSNSKEKIIISEAGVNQVYYGIKADDPSLIFIKGPGRLKVISRIIISPDNKGTGYTLIYRVDGGEKIKTDFKDIRKSGRAVLKSSLPGTPGYKKTLNIELGPGEHSVEIKSGSVSALVAAMYSFKKIKTKKVKWVMLSPVRPNEPVDLVTHENVIHYYRFSEKKPLKININGPTTLRVLTRFENHYNMKGRINYRIQVKQDNQVLNSFLLSSVYSEVTAYKHNLKLVPGKAREFFIQVPSGRHNYTIIPLDKDKNTILARVLFPKKDVKLED